MVKNGEIGWSAIDELEASVSVCAGVNPLLATQTLSIVQKLRYSVLHLDPDLIEVKGSDIILHTSEAQFPALLAGLKAEGLLEKVKIVVEKE